jgi:hypothetical protein
MIVRITTEGQYRMADGQLRRLHDLDAEVVAAAESEDAELFERRFAELLDFVRTGEVLDNAHLGPSNAILPPPGTSLAEATRELTTEGLFPA